MRKKLFLANWKMNNPLRERPDFFETFFSHKRNHNDFGFAVSYLFLERIQTILKNNGAIVAAQNFHWEPCGAFTGEVSLQMLKDINISWSLVGHSERRQLFGDSDETIAKKVTAAWKNKFNIVVCVGETLEERRSNLTHDVITKQTLSALNAINNLQYITLAYEPVWAIGTGLTATAQQAQEVHQLMRSLIEEKFGKVAASQIRILYGGSMNETNAKELVSQHDIDGGLVGGASLKPDIFAAICSVA